MATIVRANFPYQFFVDQTGAPLDAGYVYIGQVNKDPRTYPVTAYWDTAGTIPAGATLRTSNGFLSRAGTPANVFVGGSYSMLVLDKNKSQVYYVADSAAAAESTAGTVTPADGTLSWEPVAVAALTTASAALRRTGSDTPDPTLPPAPVGVVATPGSLSCGIGWTQASYTAGHGPGRVILYAAEWVGETAPLVGDARALGALSEPVGYESLRIDPQKKVRVWVSFESADGFEGPKSQPVDATSNLLGRAEISDLLITQADISSALELGRLANDPSFAGGVAAWPRFVQRAARTDAAAPPNAPAEFCAAFTGRDGISTRKLSVEEGENYLVSVWFNALNTGLTGGVCIYEYYGDGRPVTAQALDAPLPAANTWVKVKAVFKASAGAVAWQIGPHINQAHSGTAVCWFANLRIAEMVDTDLIVKGAIVGDSLAVRSINTENIVVGAATDAVSSAEVMQVFRIETGNMSTASVYQSVKPYVEVPLSRPIKRGMLHVRARFECSLNSVGANQLLFFHVLPSWGLMKAGSEELLADIGQNVEEPPIPWRYESPTAPKTKVVANFSRNYSMFVDLAAYESARFILSLIFSGAQNNNNRDPWQVGPQEKMQCLVFCKATFVENRV